jgi:hypothetical protein
VIQPGIGAASVPQGSNESLRDDGANFSSGSTHSVCCGSIPSGEDLTRNDESGGVGAKVLEKVGKAIERKQSAGGDLVETKADNTEQDSKDGKTSDLDRLAADGVDCCNRNPVAGNKTCDGKDEITNTRVVEPCVSLVKLWTTFGKYFRRQRNRLHRG